MDRVKPSKEARDTNTLRDEYLLLAPSLEVRKGNVPRRAQYQKILDKWLDEQLASLRRKYGPGWQFAGWEKGDELGTLFARIRRYKRPAVVEVQAGFEKVEVPSDA